MSDLSISNVINITLQNAPSGLAPRIANNVAIFTSESPSNSDVFRTYVNPSDVATDYGTSSTTYQMANNIFSQSPNILAGKGSLHIIPFAGVSGVIAKTVTSDISANLAGLKLVNDGEFTIDVDGDSFDITGLDFTLASSLSDIADIMSRESDLRNVYISVADDKITFKSKTVGAESSIVLTALSGGTGTDLTGASYFNITGATVTAGANSSGETILEAIARTSALVPYVGIITNIDIEDAKISLIASGVQAMDKIFLHHFASITSVSGIATTIKGATQTKTRCLLYSKESLETANLMKCAYVGRAFSMNFSGENTAITMNLKSLVNVTADSLSQTELNACLTAGVDVYVSFAGVSSVASHSNGLFFDQVLLRIALKFKLEENGFNVLRTTNTKVPQTESGMINLKSAYIKGLKAFVTNGYIGAGTWNSPDTFGNFDDFKRNISDFGYYVYSLPVSEQAQAERELREAPLVQIAFKEAGAIHSSNVLVSIEA